MDIGDCGWSAERIWSVPATDKFRTEGFSGVKGRAATERVFDPDRDPDELRVDEVELIFFYLDWRVFFNDTVFETTKLDK